MADSGGHWNNLAELQKLTVSTLVPGVVETEIKRNNPIKRVPIFHGNSIGKSLKWLEELTTAEADVQGIAIGGQTSWSEGLTYTEREIVLTAKYIQRKLDTYVQSIYGNVNNYEAQMLLESKKACIMKLGDAFIYDDIDYADTQFRGIHAWVARDDTTVAAHTAATDTLNQFATGSATGALSLAVIRNMMDTGRLGWHEIWLPFCIQQRIDAAYQEKGFAGLATATAGNLGYISYGIDKAGQRVAYWNQAPFICTDYLVAEQVGTGTGASADKRAKFATGTRNYSMFFVHFGNPLSSLDPGVAFGFGEPANSAGVMIDEGFFELTTFDKLEDYIGKGIRLVNFGTPVRSSPLALGRIFDITNTAITV